MVIAERFRYDGKSSFVLNEKQIKTIAQIEDKIKKGEYIFEKVPCQCCNSKDFETLSEKDQFGMRLFVVICRKCGLVQANPRMTEETCREFYDKEYDLLHRSHINFAEQFKHQRFRGIKIYRYLQENWKSNLSGLKVFEVGCGTGGILHYFKEQGNEVLGCDLEPKSVAFGRDKKGLDLKLGTTGDFQLPWIADIVIVSHIIEHFPKPVEEMVKLKRIMGKNSIVYIETPGIRNLNCDCRYRGDFLRLLQNAHLYYFTLKTLKNIMGKAGYGVISRNENIWSIFKPSEKRVKWESDYDALSYLKWMEFYRFIPTPRKAWRFTKSTLKVLTKKLGIYKACRHLYRLVKNVPHS